MLPRTRRFAQLFVVVAAVVMFGLGAIGRSMVARAAATFTVTTTADLPASAAACPATASKPCTLRAAIAAASAAGGDNVITFVPSATGTFPVTSAAGGELVVQNVASLAIRGLGASRTVLDAAGEHHRVITINSGPRVTISGVTIQGGVVSGAFPVGGGIASSGTLLLEDSIVQGNQAGPIPGGGGGGGIASFGSLRLRRVTVRNNTVLVQGDGRQNANSDGAGGGVLEESGGPVSLEVRDATVAGNRVVRLANAEPSVLEGGGIAVVSFGRMQVTISGSTISGNRLSNPVAGSRDLAFGAGVSVRRSAAPGFLAELQNDTVDSNSIEASGGAARAGGGLALQGGGGTYRLSAVTLSGNRAPTGSALEVSDPQPLIKMRSTILSSDAGNNCSADGGATLSGISEGGNLDSGQTCGFGGAGDIVNADPGLLPLGDNGGPTQTKAITATSPAFDAVPAALCPPPTVDQRGVARPQGKLCDVGAFELVKVTPAPAGSPPGLPRAGSGAMAPR